jgi:hypothetical protein
MALEAFFRRQVSLAGICIREPAIFLLAGANNSQSYSGMCVSADSKVGGVEHSLKSAYQAVVNYQTGCRKGRGRRKSYVCPSKVIAVADSQRMSDEAQNKYLVDYR